MRDKRLTIVLLVKGRNEFTFRWFDYAIENKLPFHTIVADGGLENNVKSSFESSDLGCDISYEYLKYPEDCNPHVFYGKVANVLGRVQSPYVLLASNDDFIFFDSLYEDLNFLDANPHYVTSRGSVWDLVISGSGGKDLYGKILDVSLLYKHESAIGSTAFERIEKYSNRANSVWHDVVRTEVLKSAYESLVESQLFDYSMHESLVSFYVACYGNINRRKEPYMLHQVHDDMAAKKILVDSPAEWICNLGWDEELAKMTSVIAAKISTLDGIDYELAKSHFLACYCKNIALHKLRDFYATSIGKPNNRLLIKNALKRGLRVIGFGGVLALRNTIRDYLIVKAPFPLHNNETFKKVQIFLSKNENKFN